MFPLGGEVSLELIYREVKKISERIGFLEDLIEEIIISELPRRRLSEEEVKEIKEAIEEMRKGEYVDLEELRSA